jgi:hypothetical protein
MLPLLLVPFAVTTLPASAAKAASGLASRNDDITLLKRQLEGLDPARPESIHLAIRTCRALLERPGVDRQRRTRAWQSLRRIHYIIVERWNARIGADQALATALDCHAHTNCKVSALDRPRVEKLLASIGRHGAMLRQANRSSWLEPDVAWLARQLRHLLAPDDAVIARLLATEQRRPVRVDTALVVSLDEIFERISNWKEVLKIHPGTARKTLVNDHIEALMRIYMQPGAWTPGDIDVAQLYADQRRSYRAFLAAFPKDAEARRIRALLSRLQSPGGKQTKAVVQALSMIDAAVQEVATLRQKANAISTNPQQRHAVSKEFAAWIRGLDGRLSNAVHGLDRGDAKRVSSHANTRLYPAIETLIATLRRQRVPLPARVRRGMARHDGRR